MKKSSELAKLLFVLLSAIVLSSCAKVPIRDKEVCADLGIAGAQCAHSYTNNRRTLNKAQWDRERVGWMCTHHEAYTDTEDSIEELCRATNLCDYQTKRAIAKMKAQLAPIARKARAARHSALMSGEIEEPSPADLKSLIQQEPVE